MMKAKLCLKKSWTSLFHDIETKTNTQSFKRNMIFEGFMERSQSIYQRRLEDSRREYETFLVTKGG